MRGASSSVPRSAAPSDVAPAPGPSGAMGLGLSGLLLLGSPGFLPLPID
jgi:hypothetical protein